MENFIQLIQEIQERVDRETDLLSDEEILARLSGETPTKIRPQSLRRRITEADRIRAKALGIRL